MVYKENGYERNYKCSYYYQGEKNKKKKGKKVSLFNILLSVVLVIGIIMMGMFYYLLKTLDEVEVSNMDWNEFDEEAIS